MAVGETVPVTETTTGRALKEISKWDPDAAREDNERYFYKYPQIEQVLLGQRAIVVGRKGTGKTAIFEFIRRQENYKTFVAPLKFSNFSFDILYKMVDRRFSGPTKYIAIWKYIIYSNLCGLLLRDQSIANESLLELRKAFPAFTDEKIKAYIPKIRKDSLRLEIPEFLSLSSEEGLPAGEIDWVNAVDTLEQALQEITVKNKYYVLFDSLDDDFQRLVERDDTGKIILASEYLDLVTGLIKAVYDIKAIFDNKGGGGSAICPVVFISSDIVGLLRDRDRGKWESIFFDLKWGRSEIENFIAFRISRAVSATSRPMHFDHAWQTLFRKSMIQLARINAKRTAHAAAGNDVRRIPVFDYVLQKTLLRPRDFVSFLKPLAVHQVRWGRELISARDVLNCEMAYSKYFRQEFIDEIGPVVPEVDVIFEIISEVKKPIVKNQELSDRIRAAINSGRLRTPKDYSVNVIIRLLWDYDVIGFFDSRSATRVFKYVSPAESFSNDADIIVHSGLYRILGITRPPLGEKTIERESVREDADLEVEQFASDAG